MQVKTLDYFIQENLKSRPYFFSFIRPQEAVLFEKYKRYCKKIILDFGCGDGFFAETIFGKNTIDIGLDVPSSRMEMARKNNVYKKIISYEGIYIPLESSSVHSIISNCVFEHIPHIEMSLVEMNRILKPGGHLITSVMCSTWSENLNGKKFLGLPYVRWFNKMQEHNSLLSKKQWMELFEKNGFEIVKDEDYLYERASKMVEINHFLSLPSLILHALTGKWTFGSPHSKVEMKSIHTLIGSDKKNPSACFFVLRKK